MDESGWQGSNDPAAMLRFLGAKASDRQLRLFAAACCRLVWGFLVEPVSREAVQTAEQIADGRASPAEQDAAFRRADHVAQSLQGVFICGGVNVPGSNYAAMAVAGAVSPRLFFEDTDSDEGPKRYAPWHCAALAVGQEAHEHIQSSFPLGDEDEQQPSDAWYKKRDAAASAAWAAGCAQAQAEQCRLLRDIVNPFYCPVPAADWRTPTVLALAHAAAEARELPAAGTETEIPTRLTYQQIGERAWKRDWPAGHLEPFRLAVLADALQDAGCSDDALLAHLRGPGPHVRGCWALDAVIAHG